MTLAQEMAFKEHSMYVYIEKLRSIEEAVKNSGVCRRWHWLGGGRQPYLLAEKGRTV